MNIPKFFIRNWQFTICAVLFCFLLGIQAFLSIPKSEDPLFPLPQYQVVAIYPGASPVDMEQLVVKPIESAIGGLADIEYIKANINDGVASIQVRFLQNTDEDKKYDEVLREVNNIRSSLPDEIASLEVLQASTSNVNILQYAIVDDNKSYGELELIAEEVKAAIEKVYGIKKVEVSALPKQQISVDLDLQRMAALGVTLTGISSAIQNGSIEIPGGVY